MTPIGRGQRELIIGDRKTGKTAIAIDAILNQKGQGVICVYVAVAQKESTTAALVDVLRRHGAMDYTIVVAAGASDPAPLQYIAPYAGCAMAEYFMYEKGGATLVRLRRPVEAGRRLPRALAAAPPPARPRGLPRRRLLRPLAAARAVGQAGQQVRDRARARPRPTTSPRTGASTSKVYLGVPGLEEAKHELKEHYPQGHKVVKTTTSGGSLTALPLIETLEGEVSAYIPTNVISITDGQIYLQPDLFFAGVRPAVDVGISVSRVGGKAQIPAMKKVAGGLRLDLAAFRELEAFAQLGTELDKATQLQLDRGYRMVELLKQPQYQPMDVDRPGHEHLRRHRRATSTTSPVKEVQKWEAEFLRFMRDQKSERPRPAWSSEKKLTDADPGRPEGRADRVQGSGTARRREGRRTGPGRREARSRAVHRGAGGAARPISPRSPSSAHPHERPTRERDPPMAKARAIVKRRKSVQNIRKITRTMELIATARFKKALDRATEAEAYTRKIAELVADLGATRPRSRTRCWRSASRSSGRSCSS